MNTFHYHWLMLWQDKDGCSPSRFRRLFWYCQLSICTIWKNSKIQKLDWNRQCINLRSKINWFTWFLPFLSFSSTVYHHASTKSSWNLVDNWLRYNEDLLLIQVCSAFLLSRCDLRPLETPEALVIKWFTVHINMRMS